MNLKQGLACAATALAVCSGGAWAVDTVEVEPNDSKSSATLVSPGGLGMAAGDTFSGRSTGTSTVTPGASSADYFLVETRARPLGIYRYRLVLNGATAYQMSIRGLTQTAGVPNAGTDAIFQTGSSTLNANAKTVQWYGFGRRDRVYIRVSGNSTTNSDYSCVLQVDPVTITDIAGVVDGTVTMRENPVTDPTTADTEMIVYDANYNPIPGYSHDNADTAGLVRTYTAGVHYVAWSLANVANDQPAPSDDANQTAAVLDFPNIVATSSTLAANSIPLDVISDAGTVTTFFSRTSPFDIEWGRINMAVNNIPLPPTCMASATPTTILNDGTGMFNISVNITPGVRPASIQHTVTADLSALGVSPPIVTLTQISSTSYSTDVLVPNGTTAGAYGINCTVQETSPQTRSSICSFNITIVNPPTGGCCTNDGCLVLTAAECANQLGSYNGNGTTCGGCACSGNEPPSNDFCADAIILTTDSPQAGSTCAAQIDTGTPVCNQQTISAGGLWYKVRGNGNTFTVDACSSDPGTTFDTRLSAYCGTCDNLTCITGNDDSCGLRSRITFCTQNAVDYYILIHGFGAGRGSFVLTLTDLGTACTPTVFCIAQGGCCTSSGCTQTTAADCASQGGTYLGDNAACNTRTTTPSFSSQDSFPIFIPDPVGGVPGMAVSTINIPANSGTVQDLAVLINITHTYVGDLIGTLSNGSVTATLFSREGAGANLIGDYIFADYGATRLGGSGSAIEVPLGIYSCLTPLSDFNGQPYEGTWTLTITDNVGADTGNINAFQFITVTTTSNCSSCPSCAADFNQDGGVDGQDVESFFTSFASGEACSDVNQDGGVDGQDVESFFRLFVAGGC